MPVTAPPLEAPPRTIERELNDFSGGMNTRDDPTALKMNEMVLIRNARITKQRALKRRGGVEQNGTTLTADTTSTITGEYQYFDDEDTMHDLRILASSPTAAKMQEKLSGIWTDISGATFTTDNIPYFITFRGTRGNAVISGTASAGSEYSLTSVGAITQNAYAGKVLKITAGTGSGQHRVILSNTSAVFELVERWDTTPDATSTYQVYTLADNCYIFNGVDRPMMYEGIGGVITSLTTLKRYRGAVVHKNKWLAWGGPDVDDDNVEWSTEDFGGDHPKNAFQEIYTTRGESVVGAMGDVNNRAIIFKQRTTHALLGDSIESFSIADIDGGIGCIAPFTIKSYGGLVYFLSNRGVDVTDGIRVGFGRDRKPISDVIRPNVQEWYDALQATFTSEIFDQRYYIAVAASNTSASKDQMWIYDINFNSWVYDDGYYPGALCVRKDTHGNDTLCFGDSRANGKSWNLEVGTDDDGEETQMEMVTGKLKVSTMARNKNFEKAYYVVPSTEDTEIFDVARQVDDNGWVGIDTFSLSNNPLILPFTLPGTFGSIGINTFSRFIIDQGHFLQHRFRNYGVNELVSLLGYTVIASDLSLP